jgi:glucose/arabinose dehydrogenase
LAEETEGQDTGTEAVAGRVGPAAVALSLFFTFASLAFAPAITAAQAQLPPTLQPVGLPPTPSAVTPPEPSASGQLQGRGTSSENPLQGVASPASRIPRITQSNLAIDLADFARIPASDSNPPLAKLNFLFSAADGSGRLFVNDMRGMIYIIKDGVVLPTPFLDIANARVPRFFSEGGGNSEVGLLTFAFHPDFNHKGMPGYGKFYTLAAQRSLLVDDGSVPVFRGPRMPPHHFNVLSEWSVDPKDPNRIDPGSRREILRLAAHSDDHGGGQLGFNPNASPRDPDYGLLYISVGDGGNTVWDHDKVEEYHLAQNMMSAFGKILRINPLRSGSRSYSVPSSNPFFGRKDVLPEIWVSGLRNPERFSWDRGGGKKMLIADIGQATVEEINLGKAGANYGWGTYEGDFFVDHLNQNNLTPLPNGKVPAGFSFPVAAYSHADGIAITGGFVYRGKQVPELSGKYIFGDLASGALFYADANSLEAGTKTPIYRLRIFYHGAEAATTAEAVLKSRRADLRLGLGEDGEIYVLTKTDGGIRKIARHTR